MGQRLQGQGFRKARDALQEHVTVREQGNQQSVEEVRLTDDDSPHLFPQWPDPIRVFGHHFARGAHFGYRPRRNDTRLGDDALAWLRFRIEGLLAQGRGSFLIHVPQILLDDIRETPGGASNIIWSFPGDSDELNGRIPGKYWTLLRQACRWLDSAPPFEIHVGRWFHFPGMRRCRSSIIAAEQVLASGRVASSSQRGCLAGCRSALPMLHLGMRRPSTSA